MKVGDKIQDDNNAYLKKRKQATKLPSRIALVASMLPLYKPLKAINFDFDLPKDGLPNLSRQRGASGCRKQYRA